MKLRPIQVIGYSAGDAANNLAFSITSFFLLLYYTDVAGLSAAAVGTMFLVVRLWDAVSDVVAGRIVDRTSTRWGKFRPFLLFGSLPLLVMSFLTFHVPDWSPHGKLVYAYLTYAALGFLYSLVNIPYGSLATAMTQDPRQRARLASARGVGAGLVIIMLVLVISPRIGKAGESLQQVFTVVTGAFILIGVALYLFTFFTSRESVERAVDRVSLRQTLKTLAHNRVLLRLCLSTLVYLTGMFAFNTIGAYYARDVLGDASLFVVLTLIGTGIMFLIAPLTPRVVARYGKRNGYLAAAAMSVLGGIGIFLAPSSTPVVAIVSWTVAGAGLALVNTLMWALEADTVEYGEWQTGVRAEGATYAVFSFTRKAGQALGGAAAAYALSLGGYVAKAPEQSHAALTAIRGTAGLLPAATALVAALVMAFYPLTESRFAQILADVQARRRGMQPVPQPTGDVPAAGKPVVLDLQPAAIPLQGTVLGG